MADYTFWQNALAGTFGPVHDADPQPGFYRKRTGKAAGYVPVAIWEQDGKILALLDGREASADDVWTYVCQHPVTEEQYHARMDTGKWHDEDASVSASLAPPPAGHNKPPTDEAEILKDQIDAASAGVEEYAQINDDETAAKAQSLRSRLLELSGQADSVREAQKKPHFEAGKTIDAKFQPLIKAAKAGADAIRAALGAHETKKAQAQAAAQKVVDDARRVAEAEALKKAEKAIKAGRPIPVAAPIPPPPEPLPAPTLKVAGAYGRAASVKVIKIATVTDQDAAYGYLKSQAEMSALIRKLAQKAVDAGFTVPGVTIEEKRDVR